MFSTEVDERPSFMLNSTRGASQIIGQYCVYGQALLIPKYRNA